jgi:uncharacterized protein DUF6059
VLESWVAVRSVTRRALVAWFGGLRYAAFAYFCFPECFVEDEISQEPGPGHPERLAGEPMSAAEEAIWAHLNDLR